MVICEGDTEKAKWSYIKEKARLTADVEDEKRRFEVELAKRHLAEIEASKREANAAQNRQFVEVALTLILGVFAIFILIILAARG